MKLYECSTARVDGGYKYRTRYPGGGTLLLDMKSKMARCDAWNAGRALRGNARAAIDVSDWGMTVVLLIVLVILVGALMPTLTSTLADYAGNETVIGPVLETLVPILVSIAILLVAVVVLLKKATGGE